MATRPRFGLGFRTQHFAELRERPRGVDWLELLSDNFLGVGGPRRAMLEALRAEWPVALHGVGLGIANDAPPRSEYLAALRELADLVDPLFVSDHLCWTGHGGVESHDLLPVAITREVLALVAERVARVQDALGRRLLLENASAYVKFRADEMSEAELLAALCERTGCGVLLDVNNLVVNARNLGADPEAALAALEPHHVGYFHVAGHTLLPDVCVDTHGAPVQDVVWRLFERAAARFPEASVMLERDDAIPPLAALVAELDEARARWHSGQRSGASSPSVAPVSPRSDALFRTPWRTAQRAFWEGIAPSAPAVPVLATRRLLEARAPVAPQRGLRVYRDAHAQMPARALTANFPTLARVLTRRDFAALAAAFARAHPSRSHDYARFGAPLADFVARLPLSDDYGVGAAAFADIARLEQAQLEVQEAEDERAELTPQCLAALSADDWEASHFRFARALRIVRARYDVLPAIRAVARGEAPALPERTRTAYLVTRGITGVRVDAVEDAAARALTALVDGACFAAACVRAGGAEAAPAAARALALACARGALLGRSVNAPRAAVRAGELAPL